MNMRIYLITANSLKLIANIKLFVVVAAVNGYNGTFIWVMQLNDPRCATVMKMTLITESFPQFH